MPGAITTFDDVNDQYTRITKFVEKLDGKREIADSKLVGISYTIYYK